MRSDTTNRKLAIVLLVGFSVRIVAGLLSGATQGGDAGEYLRLAHNLATGHGFSLAAHAPFTPTDWRLPGYSALLVPVQWLDAAHAGAVVLNSLLGTAAVWAVALIAGRVFSQRSALALAAAWAAALYPPAVTFAGLVMSENLVYAAGCWFIYLVFFADIGSGPRLAIWLAGVFAAGSILSLARAEGLLIVLLGLLVALAVGRIPIKVAAIAILAALILPAAWVARNDAQLGRLELTDSIYRDANLLLSVNDGNPTDPLYGRGVALAYRGRPSPRDRADYHAAVMHRISHTLSTEPGHVLSFKAKGIANFFFVPPVWNWAIEHFADNYTLGDAARHPSGRNAGRLVWSIVLLVQYAVALLGLWLWVSRRRYSEVCGMLLYPVVALALTVPFQADQRQWTFGAFLMIVPAVEGIAWMVHSARRPALQAAT